MFDALNTDNLEEFRSALVDEMVVFLKSCKQKNSGIEDTAGWGLVQQIKGKILSDQPLADIIRESANISLSHHDLSLLLSELTAIGKKYADVVSKDQDLQASTISTGISAAGSALFKMPSKVAISSSSISDRLAVQVNSLNDKSVDKSELVKLFMAMGEGAKYHGFYVDMHNVSVLDGDGSAKNLAEINLQANKNLIASIDSIIEYGLKNNINRLQIIVRFTDHYIPIDIDIKNKSCFIFDASRDFRRTRLHSIVEHSKYITDAVIDAHSPAFEHKGEKRDGKLQKSERGCWLYSLYMSDHVARIDDIHRDLMSGSIQVNKLHSIEWTSLPPELVVMSESVLFFDYYINSRPECAAAVNKLTNNNTKGYGFDRVLADYQERLKNICVAKTDKEIEAIIVRFENKQAADTLAYKS